jgi:hypothetical protein
MEREGRKIEVYGYPSAEACFMGYQIVEQLRADTYEAMVRAINQRLGQWRSQIISVGLPPHEHVKSELLEETKKDRFGNVESTRYQGHILLSDEAFAKIK